MYCPKCGATFPEDQKFCRSCGMDLQVISQELAKGRSPTSTDKLLVRSDASRLHQLYGMLLWGVGSVLVGMALIAIGKQSEIVGTIGLLLTLAGAFLALYGVLSPFRPQKIAPHKQSESTALPQVETTAKLPPGTLPDAIASVTEHTTHTLDPALLKQPKIHR